MATVVNVVDRQKLKSVDYRGFDETPEPEQEAATVASLRLKYPDDDKFEIEVIHGESVAKIREGSFSFRK